jgi:hypothetical protein
MLIFSVVEVTVDETVDTLAQIKTLTTHCTQIFFPFILKQETLISLKNDFHKPLKWISSSLNSLVQMY